MNNQEIVENPLSLKYRKELSSLDFCTAEKPMNEFPQKQKERLWLSALPFHQWLLLSLSKKSPRKAVLLLNTAQTHLCVVKKHTDLQIKFLNAFSASRTRHFIPASWETGLSDIHCIAGNSLWVWLKSRQSTAPLISSASELHPSVLTCYFHTDWRSKSLES